MKTAHCILERGGVCVCVVTAHVLSSGTRFGIL